MVYYTIVKMAWCPEKTGQKAVGLGNAEKLNMSRVQREADRSC